MGLSRFGGLVKGLGVARRRPFATSSSSSSSSSSTAAGDGMIVRGTDGNFAFRLLTPLLKTVLNQTAKTCGFGFTQNRTKPNRTHPYGKLKFINIGDLNDKSRTRKNRLRVELKVNYYIFEIQNPNSERVRGQKPRLSTNCGRRRPAPVVRVGYDNRAAILVDRLDHSGACSYRGPLENPHGAVLKYTRHHRLVAPYTYGAMYNHPIKGLLVDTMSGAVSFLAFDMSPRMSIFFFSFTTVKVVDDHHGMWIP
ncbi:hypothetical protein DVH24_017791 [Malus domestica]|uniref:Uncharacterized protein n=1 Tax=Malus domestica TaxID=3750 RepID=A0A498KC51_MALDO|nr:hypothetical protein DVH24_017791 [Malus domestica]